MGAPSGPYDFSPIQTSAPEGAAFPVTSTVSRPNPFGTAPGLPLAVLATVVDVPALPVVAVGFVAVFVVVSSSPDVAFAVEVLLVVEAVVVSVLCPRPRAHATTTAASKSTPHAPTTTATI